jgi:hypothetical protein
MNKPTLVQLFAAALVLLLVSVFIPGWVFKRSETAWQHRPALALTVPQEATVLTSLKDTTAGKILSFDHSDCYLVDAGVISPKAKLHVTALKYDPGNSYLQRDVYEHSPEICLPASGAKLEKGPITANSQVDGLPVRIEQYTFSHPIYSSQLHVFKLVWIGEIDETLVAHGPENRWKSRLEMIRSSDKNPPGLVVIGVVYNTDDESIASRIFLEHIQRSCHRSAALTAR